MSARLPAALEAWDGGGDAFTAALKRELTALPAGSLPLDRGTSQGGYVDENGLVVSVLAAHDGGDALRVRVGVFFTEIVASCGCGDEPMATPAYCELDVHIDRRTAAAAFTMA